MYIFLGILISKDIVVLTSKHAYTCIWWLVCRKWSYGYYIASLKQECYKWCWCIDTYHLLLLRCFLRIINYLITAVSCRRVTNDRPSFILRFTSSLKSGSRWILFPKDVLSLHVPLGVNELLTISQWCSCLRHHRLRECGIFGVNSQHVENLEHPGVT